MTVMLDAGWHRVLTMIHSSTGEMFSFVVIFVVNFVEPIAQPFTHDSAEVDGRGCARTKR